MTRIFASLDRWTGLYIDRVFRHKYLIIGATLIAVIASGAGMSRIGFNTNYRAFFSAENPYLQAFDELENTYTKVDNVFFVVATDDREVFDRNTIEALNWLTDASWQIPYSTRVDSITNFQHTEARGDTLIVEDLYTETPDFLDAPRPFEQVREISNTEPLLARRLISEDGRVTGINVTIQRPGESTQENKEIVRSVRALETELEAKFPGHRVYSTGMIMLNDAFMTSSETDMATLVPLMYLIILIAAGVFLRSIWGTIAVMLVIVFSIVTAMGLAGWMGILLTPPSASTPTIIMTLAVADSMHILVVALSKMRGGSDKIAALKESLRINMQPVFLTSFTTVVGFLSLNFGELPPFHDLGNMTAIGVTAAFVYSVAFLPAFFAAVPARVRVRPASQQSALIDCFADFAIGRHRYLLGGGLAIFIGLAAFIPRLENNEQWVQYFDHSIEFRTDSEYTIENLTGLYQTEYSMSSGDTGGVADPDYLAHVDKFAVWLREQPEVFHVYSFTDTMRRLNRNMHADRPEYYRVPEERDLAAQYLLLYEMSLPYGLDLNDRVDVDKSATRLTVTIDDLTTSEMLALEQRSIDWQAQNLPAHMRATPSGPTVMFSHIAERNVNSLVGGAFVALGVITLIMILALRSWRFGVLTIIPNLVPAMMTFGLWGLSVVRVDIAAATVIATTLGIVVDDSVHFMSKYVRSLREGGGGVDEAIRYTFRNVGPALILTSLILISGFAVLALSTFRMNWTLGVLSALTIAFALLWDLLVLPGILLITQKFQNVPINSKTSLTGAGK